MNRQQQPGMNTSDNNDTFILLQDVEENYSDEHFVCDMLSTIEEENTKDISERSDSDSISTNHCPEFLLDGLETIDKTDCRSGLLWNQPQKQVTLNHAVSNCKRGSAADELDQEVQWGKSGVTCGSSNSLRSLSSRATLSTASLSRSPSSSSTLSSSRQLHSQMLPQTPQPNEVFKIVPNGEHQWIGENIEINQADEQFVSIESLDSLLCADAMESSSSLLERTAVQSKNDNKIPYEESDDEFQVDPEWFHRQLMRRQLEARIQKIEQTIMKLRLADANTSSGN